MSFTYHATTFLKVNRNGDTLRAECTLLSNDIEAVAWIEANVQTLKISRAGWANYRSPANQAGIFDLPELIGADAYITGGPALKKALGRPGLEIPYELIGECFRGVLQAETFFFLERGFQSARQYDDFCEQHSIGDCRYYSHLDQTEKQWTEWVETTERSYNLFNRSKTVTIVQQETNRIVTAVFMDSFHHLGIGLEMDQNGAVLSAQSNFISAPDPICYKNREHLAKFIGMNLGQMSKKEIAALAGGAEGCSHLVDLLYEIKKTLPFCLKNLGCL
jgi:hypothetical protein